MPPYSDLKDFLSDEEYLKLYSLYIGYLKYLADKNERVKEPHLIHSEGVHEWDEVFDLIKSGNVEIVEMINRFTK